MDLLKRLCGGFSHERVVILVEGKAQRILDRRSGAFTGVPFEKLHERAGCCDATFGAVVSASFGAHSLAEQGASLAMPCAGPVFRFECCVTPAIGSAC